MPQRAFLLSLHLHTTRQPLPLGDNLFPGSASLCSPRIHPHRHPLSHFPKQKNTFLAARLGLFFPSLGCLKTQSSTSKTLTIPIYPVNLTPFSLCSSFLLWNTHVLTHIRAQPQTHTYLKFISAAIQMQRSNFQYWYIYREKHRDPSRHTHMCAHACKIISLLERWPQTSGQFLMDPDVKICFLFLYRVVRLSLKI